MLANPMFPVTSATAHLTPHRPIQATAIACFVSMVVHAAIWQSWQDNAVTPLPEVKPSLLVEVALTSVPSQMTPATAPPPVRPVVTKPQPKPAEVAKPIAKPKPKPVANPPEPKKTKLEKTKPGTEAKPKEMPIAEAVIFSPTPAFAPLPAKANPKSASATTSQPLVKAAYSAPGLKTPPTRYPKIAEMRQWEGTVLLEVRVLANGSAGEIKILSSSGHEILDESAVEQVKSWHFIPAHQGDKTVEDSVRVPVSFKLKS